MSSADTRPPLRALRMASLAEGTTLLLLVLVAVPLKRMADLPLAVSIAGPLHGAAFLVYGALVLQALSARLLSASEALRLMAAAFVPLGAWWVAGWLRRRQALVQSQPQPQSMDARRQP